MSEYLEFGCALALRAGEIMQSERGGYLDIQQKADRTLVTKIDLAIQDLAIDEIVRNFPGHAIIGEEKTYGSPNAKHIWRIDPLDGTGEYIEGGDPANLSYGFGLAKQCDDKIEAGLFFNPSKAELYTAAHGLGAFLNGQPIRVNQAEFAPGIAHDYTHWSSSLGDAHSLESTIGPSLNHYSAIYKTCMVACGRSAFSIFLGRTAHDIAPGTILVQEAGGRVSDVYGRPHNWRGELYGAVNSNGITHQGALGAIVLKDQR